MPTPLDIHISRLLYDYDCVIIPQFGGFVANYRPARIDEKLGIAHAPAKDVRFNRNLSKNDGLLAQACANVEGWSFEEANDYIRQSVEKYLQDLNTGVKVKFKKIGVLYFDDHQNLRFEPSNDQNFLKASFGFEDFILPPAVAQPSVPSLSPEVSESSIEQKVVVPISDAPREILESDQSTRGIYWVAAATLLPFIGLSLYVALVTDFKSPSEITVADLNPFATAKEIAVSYTPRIILESAIAPVPHHAGFPENTAIFPFSFETQRVDSTGVWVNLDKTTQPNPINKTSDRGKLYHIIAGCFGAEENAHKFVSNLNSQGHDAEILDVHKNLHRVRLRSFEDYGTALVALESARNSGQFPNAWLLKKPLS